MKNRELVVAKLVAIGEKIIKNADTLIEKDPVVFEDSYSIDISITLSENYDECTITNYKNSMNNNEEEVLSCKTDKLSKYSPEELVNIIINRGFTFDELDVLNMYKLDKNDSRLMTINLLNDMLEIEADLKSQSDLLVYCKKLAWDQTIKNRNLPNFGALQYNAFSYMIDLLQDDSQFWPDLFNYLNDKNTEAEE